MRALATAEIVDGERERAALVDWIATGHSRYPGYGMGLMTRTSAQGECIGHDGRMPGYGALAMYCPAIDASVVLLVDRDLDDLDERFDAVLAAVAS